MAQIDGVNPPRCAGKTQALAIGRTWRLVNDAREGDVLIVAHWQERHNVERMLVAMGRNPNAVRVLMLAEHLDERLRGLPHDRRIYLDHRIATDIHPARSAPTLHALRELAQGRGVPLLWEPCDTLAPGSAPGDEQGRGGISGA